MTTSACTHSTGGDGKQAMSATMEVATHGSCGEGARQTAHTTPHSKGSAHSQAQLMHCTAPPPCTCSSPQGVGSLPCCGLRLQAGRGHRRQAEHRQQVRPAPQGEARVWPSAGKSAAALLAARRAWAAARVQRKGSASSRHQQFTAGSSRAALATPHASPPRRVLSGAPPCPALREPAAAALGTDTAAPPSSRPPQT